MVTKIQGGLILGDSPTGADPGFSNRGAQKIRCTQRASRARSPFQGLHNNNNNNNNNNIGHLYCAVPILIYSTAHYIITDIIVIITPALAELPMGARIFCKKNEWKCSLFNEWIYKRVNLEWIWSEKLYFHSFWSDLSDHSKILSDHRGHSKMSENTPNSL